ncbi:hypothetical protein E1B28_003988 [Marasmius oreades]|uniref:Uncharacterized protein n=1 Tax=Marasmius oreades TaxID=181124 RepID=A0A9P8AC19_9AGAR|nr:uncharacterized protein E1B28_003988 [Marasmius oreades]KAG7096567.1 hypothetical protein E1B28_003988 [Marasmius oreades]
MQNNPGVQTSSFIDSQGPRISDQSRTTSSPSSNTRTDRNRLGPGPDRGQDIRGNETDSDSINVAGLTFAQRLYASAHVASKQGNVDADSDRNHTQIPCASAASSEHTAPNRHISRSSPHLSMETLSVNAYANSREYNTSLSTGGSLYKKVPGHTQTPSASNGGHTSHTGPSHRTRSLPIPPHISTNGNNRRASTVPTTTTTSISAFMKPYTFTPPSETPNRVLVVRPPVKHTHSQQSDTSAVPLPVKLSAIQYSSLPQYSSSPSSSASIPHNVSPASAPPPQTLSTTDTQPQIANFPPPQNPLTPPLSPPNQVKKPYNNSKNVLASAFGRAALRFVGSVVLGSIFDAVPLDSLFSGIASSVLDAGTLDTLTSSLANLSLKDVGLDSSQLQAAFTGVPGTDYQSIINSILQQQQTAPSPRVDYQAIVDALRKIQQAQMMAASNGNGSGGSGPGGAPLSTPTNYQALGNAQNQHVHGLMTAIQQQAAQNAQLLQQQMQHIQNSPQVDATHQVQGYLQAAYEQQIVMNASAGTLPQQQPQQTFHPQQQQTTLTHSLRPQQSAVQQNQPHQQQHIPSHSHQNQHQPPTPQLNHYHSTSHPQSTVHSPYQTSSSSSQHQLYPLRPTSFQPPPHPASFQNQPPRPTSLQQPSRPPLQQQQQQQQQPQQQQQVQPNQYQQPQTQPFSNQQQYGPSQSNAGQDPVYTQDPQSYPTTQYDGANYNTSEQIPGYTLTPEASTVEETAPPSFSSILGHAFDIGSQLLNGSSSSSADGGGAAPGYTLMDQGGGSGGGGETSGFNTFFDGVLSYAGSVSVDVGGNSFDFSASISGGEDV